MPTPFTHLEIAQRLLKDDAVPQSMRDLLYAERGAFLLGNIAADMRVSSNLERAATHFFDYRDGLIPFPWREMVKQSPRLMKPKDAAHRAFVAGYVAHLAVDITWSLQMVSPHFADREWSEPKIRFLMLNVILIYMDERDLPLIEPWQAETLNSASPDHWLDFATDHDLEAWQQFIYNQIKPGSTSQTLEILGERIKTSPAELRALLDSEQQMQTGLWDHISKAVLQVVEEKMYAHAREQMIIYLNETS